MPHPSFPQAPMRSAQSAAERVADLHLHTAASDGRQPPRKVVGAMAELGFAAIAITDHDEVSGIPEAFEAGREAGIEVIPGVELSATLADKEVHVLGYFVDWEAPALSEVLEACREHRRGRMRRMVEKLEALGVPVDIELVAALAGDGAIGRPHLAQALVEAGHVRSVSEAFERYLAAGRPAYMEKWKMTPAEACALIRDAGGVSVLAHPMLLKDDTLIRPIVEAGALGLEAYYAACSAETTARYVRMAEAMGLLVTGGSDCHQAPDNVLMGRVRLPYERVDALRERWEALRAAS